MGFPCMDVCVRGPIVRTSEFEPQRVPDELCDAVVSEREMPCQSHFQTA